MHGKNYKKEGVIFTTSQDVSIACYVPGHHDITSLCDILKQEGHKACIDNCVVRTADGLKIGKMTFSGDFRTVTVDDEVLYIFSKKQASFIEKLHKEGILHKHSLMCSIGSNQDNPNGLFRRKGKYHPAWDVLIKNDGRGNYWLEY